MFPTQLDSTEFPDSKTGVKSTKPVADQVTVPELDPMILEMVMVRVMVMVMVRVMVKVGREDLLILPMNSSPFPANNSVEKSLSPLAAQTPTSLSGTTVTQPTKAKKTVNFKAEWNRIDEKNTKIHVFQKLIF